MKNRILNAAYILIFSLFLIGCTNDNFYENDYDPPAAPRGVEVLNGDNLVEIYWKPNKESDLAGYNIYYSYSYSGKYFYIGSTKNTYFIDDGANNGTKYYYAVTAYDYNHNESDLSVDVVYATPRPEGFNQALFDYRRFPNTSGYSFSKYKVYPYNDLNTDFYFENYNDTLYFVVYDDSDIQDMGPTKDIYDISFAPLHGWSNTKDVFVKAGHTYIVWTWDNHFAKVRVKALTADRVVFDWAHQTVKGEQQLKPSKHVPDIRSLTFSSIKRR